jgi:putative ABC transport system permease protein
VMTLSAIVLGAAAVTFAVGLSSSLKLVVNGLSHASAEQVMVQVPVAGGPIHFAIRKGGPGGPGGPGGGTGSVPKPPSAAVAERTVTAALRAEPGTLHYTAETQDTVTVTGLAQQVEVAAFSGDSRWTGYAMISGHWFTGPGQVDVASHFLTVTGKSVGDSVTFLVGSKQVTAKIVGQIFETRNFGLYMVTDWPTLSGADHSLAATQYDVQLRPHTSVSGYVQALSDKLTPPDYFVMANDRTSDVIDLMISLIGLLTLMLAIAAGLGVLNTIVLNTRERVHDLGVFKAIGMTPRQTIAMVICWVAGTGLVASVIAVPLGMALHGYVLPAMAHSVDLGLPAAFLDVYHGGELVLLALAGVAIAVLGALLPAGWAAATRTGAALRAE